MDDWVLADQNLVVIEAIFEPRFEEVIYYFVGDLLALYCDCLVQKAQILFWYECIADGIRVVQLGRVAQMQVDFDEKLVEDAVARLQARYAAWAPQWEILGIKLTGY